jgi:hypothetical protein
MHADAAEQAAANWPALQATVMPTIAARYTRRTAQDDVCHSRQECPEHDWRSDPMRLTHAMAIALLLMTLQVHAEPATEVTVYKSPTCSCCARWVSYLEENGFKVTAHDTLDLTGIKNENGVPADLSSCHTALVEGYVVEGHVPAATLRKLLSERPALKGIALPHMPESSPGMGSPVPGSLKILGFGAEGTAVDVYNVE